jgi:hypothetical protein
MHTRSERDTEKGIWREGHTDGEAHGERQRETEIEIDSEGEAQRVRHTDTNT